jgi:hypothetical protein
VSSLASLPVDEHGRAEWTPMRAVILDRIEPRNGARLKAVNLGTLIVFESSCGASFVPGVVMPGVRLAIQCEVRDVPGPNPGFIEVFGEEACTCGYGLPQFPRHALDCPGRRS